MQLTTANHWDLQWAAVDLPVEVDVYNPYVAAIVSTICRYIQPMRVLSRSWAQHLAVT